MKDINKLRTIRKERIKTNKRKIELNKSLMAIKKLRSCTHPLPRVMITAKGLNGVGYYIVEICTHCGIRIKHRRIDQI